MATADNADLSDSLEEGSSDDEADNKGRRRRRRAQLRFSCPAALPRPPGAVPSLLPANKQG